MSNYGPPGGPYPGRGRDPHEEQPYTEPSDPWGDWGRDNNPGGYEQQGYDQGGYDRGDYNQGYGGYDQQQQRGYGGGDYDVTGTGYAQRPAEAAPGGWNPAPPGPPPGPVTPPAAPVPPAKRGGGMIALVAILVVLVLAGGAGATYVLMNSGGDDKRNEAGGDSTPQPTESSAGAPTASTDPVPSASAAASDARNVKKGECVRNVGDEAKPQMTIADCGTDGVYEVLARFDAPAAGQDDAQKKCADVEGYTNWYFFNSQLDSLDFVLCLKQR